MEIKPKNQKISVNTQRQLEREERKILVVEVAEEKAGKGRKTAEALI